MDIDFQSGEYIFAGVQIKKDAIVTEKDHDEIIKKWHDKKQEIGLLIKKEMESKNKHIHVKFVLFLINESSDQKTGKDKSEDVVVFFSDIMNTDLFKGQI